MGFWILFAVFFVLGTWMLVRLNVKRYYIVFLIKTKWGIPLLEKIAGISPRFWKLMADFAVVVSFGGVGAAYLSRHRQRRSLYFVEVLLAVGVVLLVLLKYDVKYAALASVVLLAALVSFFKAGSQVIDFLSCTLFLYLIGVEGLSLAGATTGRLGFIVLGGSVFGLPAIVLLGLWLNASSILSRESDLPGVSPLIPSSKGGRLGVSFPGYDIFIPWWHALVALIVTVVSHEFAHGILAKAQNMRVKSTGVITVGALPIGAFVEPDDEEVKKRRSIEKMRLFSAGSFANLWMCVFAAVVYLSLVVLVAFSMDIEGLEVVGTTKGYPADGVIESGTVLLEVNGKPPDIGDLFPGVAPGEDVTLKTNRGVIVLKTVESPENKSKAYIGIYSVPRVVFKDEMMNRFPWIPANRELIVFYIKIVSFLLSSLKWVMFFNFNIALVNLIPLAPFDGWHMLKELLSAFNISDKYSERIAYGVLAFTALLFLINLSPLGGKVLSTVI